MKIFIGYDPTEDTAYQVCKFSIEKHTQDTEIVPLVKKQLVNKKLYWRNIDPLSSTDFSFTRFLVPALMNYTGWALYCDCDFIWLTSLKDLFYLKNENYAVMVVKHNYDPISSTKMNGVVQHKYPRKNWSSMILWNCSHPANKLLSPNIVNTETGQFLHQFRWLDDSLIGEVPYHWNWLSGYYQSGIPKAIHYTDGGPWHNGYKNCQFNEVWQKYYTMMNE